MINLSFLCKSNHWPARLRKVVILVKKILYFENDLKFSNKIIYNCNIILTNDKLVKKMNLKYCNKKKSTDVLTFVSEINLKKSKKQKVCDIFLSAEIIKKDAERNNINFYNHLTHLLIHSFLHINGFDHKKLSDFNIMKKKEISILNKLKIHNPYLAN